MTDKLKTAKKLTPEEQAIHKRAKEKGITRAAAAEEIEREKAVKELKDTESKDTE